MRETWHSIEEWLASEAPEMLADLRPGASAEELTDVRDLLGIDLPSDVQDCYLVHNGQRGAAEPLFDGWALLPLAGVGEHWTMLSGFLDRGDFGDNQGSARGPVKPYWWSRRWVPVLHDESGNYVCVDLDPPQQGRRGQLVVYLHTSPERAVTAPSLEAFLRRFAADLAEGRYAVEDEMLVRRGDQ